MPMHKHGPSQPASAVAPLGLSGASAANERPEVQIQINSNALYLSGTRELVSCVARRLGFGEEACSQIALAVDEALANVIRHGYAKAPDRPIWIGLFPIPEDGHTGAFGDQCPARSIKIVIEDEAKQVDPSVIKSRDLDEIRPGGLGVHIIKTVMDLVHYEKREQVGMRLTMVKHRQCAADGMAKVGEAGGESANDCCKTKAGAGGAAANNTSCGAPAAAPNPTTSTASPAPRASPAPSAKDRPHA